MIDMSRPRLLRLVATLALLALGVGGCAGISDPISGAFVDPARYDQYDCKQLDAERKALSTRGAELQGLMAKAETGVAGSVVAEVAYRNDYISNRGQARLAEQVWQREKCAVAAPAAPPPAVPAAKGRAKGA